VKIELEADSEHAPHAASCTRNTTVDLWTRKKPTESEHELDSRGVGYTNRLKLAGKFFRKTGFGLSSDNRLPTSVGASFACGTCINTRLTTQGSTAGSSGEIELYATAKGLAE
jgi:hypothetical protein